MAVSLSSSSFDPPDFPSKWSKDVELVVHVVEARGLLNKDIFGGKSNPFVVLRLWAQEHVSNVIKASLDPKWNQSFTFSVYSGMSQDDSLSVTMWDKDSLFKNSFLGMVKICIGALMDHSARDLWYPLQKRSSKSRVRGAIRIWTQLTTPLHDPTIFFHSPPNTFSMPNVSATLDGASVVPSPPTKLGDKFNPTFAMTVTRTPTPSNSHPHASMECPSTLHEDDFLAIEPVCEGKGKGRMTDVDWCQRSPSLPPYLPLTSPLRSLDSTQSLPATHQAAHIYYDMYGQLVEDPDLIAIMKLEQEDKRAKEAEEDRLFREYLNMLHRCLVCGSDDRGDPLMLPCDHTFCHACLASHIRRSLQNRTIQQGELGFSTVTCPTCDTAMPEWAVKRALPTAEYEAILNQSLQSFIDSGTDIFRCPKSECGAPMERIPHMLKSNAHEQRHGCDSSIVDQHREEFRFRCRSCSTEFCSGCMSIPYHVGYTCEGYSRYLKAKHCRFCATVLVVPNGLASASSGDVCKGEDCIDKSKLSCKKRNCCGHSCCGILDEQYCMPCLHCLKGEQCAEDYCNICWVDSLGSAPSVKLKCGHVFHFGCIKNKLRKRWPAARITFGFSECPLCKHSIEHVALEEDIKPIRELKAVVQQKASQRLEFEGLSKAKEIMDPTSRFHNNRERYAMDRYAYFMCSKCSQPYFAGQRRCDAGEDEKPFDPADLVCGACSGSAPAAECATHGKDFLEWKCQFCCTVSSWYCWGKTHFCNDCHTRQQKGDYLTKKPKSAIPVCSGSDKCPLGISHPHCEEFLLGCALCRNVSTF